MRMTNQWNEHRMVDQSTTFSMPYVTIRIHIPVHALRSGRSVQRSVSLCLPVKKLFSMFECEWLPAIMKKPGHRFSSVRFLAGYSRYLLFLTIIPVQKENSAVTLF
jgi:hypothetical protein